MRISTAAVTFVAAAILLIAAGILLYREHLQYFPALAPGFYAGRITGFEDQDTPFFLRVENDTVRFLQTGRDSHELVFPMQRRLNSDTDTGKDGQCAPLSGRLFNQDIILIGSKVNEGRFSGTIQNRLSASVGEWGATKLSEAQTNLRSSQQWLTLVSQLDSSKKEKDLLEAELAQRDQEVAQLKNTVADAGSVIERAQSTEREDSAAIGAAQKEEAQLSKDIEQLRRQLELTQKLSPMGKMIQLSREVLSRESVDFKKALGERRPEEEAG